MTAVERSLMQLAEASASTIIELLGEFCGPDAIDMSSVRVETEVEAPFADFAIPAVEVSVSYTDGILGGNTFLMSVPSARGIATTMLGTNSGGVSTASAHETRLDELERSAISEAMNQLMAATAVVIGDVVSRQIGISPPRTQFVTQSAQLGSTLEASGAHVSTIDIMVFDHPCRLIQAVPHAFVILIDKAAFEQVERYSSSGGESSDRSAMTPVGDTVLGARVHLWAELGRATRQISDITRVSEGELIILDARADDPIEIYANGVSVARGRLAASAANTWSVVIEEVSPRRVARGPRIIRREERNGDGENPGR